MYVNYYRSEISLIKIINDDNYLYQLLFVKSVEEQAKESKLAYEVVNQLGAYFNKKLDKFDLPYKLNLTDFQIKVLLETAKVNYGEIVSYSDIAKQINNPKAIRAVANTLRINPLPIIIPCHRVIGKNGKLTGYNGGLHIKKYLLNLERNQ